MRKFEPPPRRHANLVGRDAQRLVDETRVGQPLQARHDGGDEFACDGEDRAPLAHARRVDYVECREGVCLSRRGVARAAWPLPPTTLVGWRRLPDRTSPLASSQVKVLRQQKQISLSVVTGDLSTRPERR